MSPSSATSSDLALITSWLDAREDEHLEFKEAKSRFDFEELVKYCAALANERGGRMILGVTDGRPRRVVGSSAFPDLERTKAGLAERLRLRVDGETLSHPDGRVVLFSVPSRPVGLPIAVRGAYWMRAGQDLVPMTPDRLRAIFDETGPDFSAEVCGQAALEDLDRRAVEIFRGLWIRKSGNRALENLPPERLLEDAELILDGRPTFSALILFGTRKALGRHLAQAEVIFEYRSTDASGPAQQREEHREGFFLFHDLLWEVLNRRNDIQHYQDGLFVWDIPTFNEAACREAILNALSHRDYRLGGSVFVRQYPRRVELVSPGGLPAGVTLENIFWRQSPRNRRLAEALARCGLVERSGQGVNRMFEEAIKESKPRPDFSGTDDFQVSVTLRGEVQDPQFLRFLEKIGQKTLASFTTEDLLLVDLVHREQPIPPEARGRLPRLAELGVLERVRRGQYILSRQLYSFLGKKGVYTRKRGLDRETNKAFLMKHIDSCREEGCQLNELHQVLPHLSRRQVQLLLQDLRARGRAHPRGRTHAARWHPGPEG